MLYKVKESKVWNHHTNEYDSYQQPWCEINAETLVSDYEMFLKDRKCYKVTFTFDRKQWQKAKSFSDVYYSLASLLNTYKVNLGLFSMELHETGFPHVHGLIHWENELDESWAALRQKLLNRYGLTKIFELKENEFPVETRKFPSWVSYVTKDYDKMVEFRQKVGRKFHIAIRFSKFDYLREEDDLESV